MTSAAPGARFSLLLLSAVLAGAIWLLHSALGGPPLALAGVAVLLAAVLVPRAQLVIVGAIVVAAGTVSLPLTRYDGVQAMLYVAGVALPVVALIGLAPRLQADAPPRPRLSGTKPTWHVLVRTSGAVALLVVAALVPPVRTAWSTDLGPTLATLLVAGAALVMFAPALVDERRDAQRVVAEPFTEQRSRRRFGVVSRFQRP